MQTIEQFENLVAKTDGCWHWIGHVSPNGYGWVSLNRKPMTAHRASYILFCGTIPAGACILHSCDNRRCVRPDHLRRGTQRENIQEMFAKGRSNTARGSRHARAIFSESDIRDIRERAISQKLAQIAFDYSCSKHAIWKVVTRRTWAHW